MNHWTAAQRKYLYHQLVKAIRVCLQLLCFNRRKGCMLYEHVCYMNNPDTQIFPIQLPYTQYVSVKLDNMLDRHPIHNTKQSDCITFSQFDAAVLYHKKMLSI